MNPHGCSNIRKAIPSQLKHLITYLKKAKHRGCNSYCYELNSGYPQIDGYYPTEGEAMSAILSENLLIKLKEIT